MTEEGLNASILRLQSFVIETYGMIKDIYKRDQEEGYVDKVAQLSMKLAQYEGALLTLRGYKQDIVDSAKIEEEEQEEEIELDPEEQDNESVIDEQYLAEKSQTFKNSQAHQKKGKKKK